MMNVTLDDILSSESAEEKASFADDRQDRIAAKAVIGGYFVVTYNIREGHSLYGNRELQLKIMQHVKDQASKAIKEAIKSTMSLYGFPEIG